eukprot:GFUD01039621.1.p1 GENE.GFUD01039621.1~~GFUD01039621.1.p1  ORF type:complete len:314 (+),score=99.02 GFUD01039621.1:54-995(+)
MAEGGDGKPKRKKTKITHTEYQIELLERLGANISQVERGQLGILKERKRLMAELGIECKATVEPNFPPPSNSFTTNQVLHANSQTAEKRVRDVVQSFSGSDQHDDSDDFETEMSEVGKDTVSEPDQSEVRKTLKKKCGQGVSGPFVLFGEQKRKELDLIDPNAKLDKKSLQDLWDKMPDDEKKVFSEKYLLEKESAGDKFRSNITMQRMSSEERKLKKKERDKLSRNNKKQASMIKTEEENALKERLEEIIIAKEKKLAELVTYVENLKLDNAEYQKMNHGVGVSVVEKDIELSIIKEHYKNLHKIHKSCKDK